MTERIMDNSSIKHNEWQEQSVERVLGADEEMLKRLQDALEKNVELYNATKENLRRLTVIYELTRAIISIKDFDELLRKIAQETAKLFNAAGCIIRLLEDGRLRIRASFGFPDESKEGMTVNIGEGIAGKVAQEGNTIIVGNADEFGFIAPNIRVHTAICTPLKIGENIIGTFGIYDKKAVSADGSENIAPFTEEDMITLEGFAPIAAIVIDKSLLYEDALKQEREAVQARERMEELKEYLQGLIENSADAIVTTDLQGIVTSWNIGAERIYGYTKQEAIGLFMPFIPDFLMSLEKSYTERVKNGETIKDIETLRRTKDGRLIDVSLTLSPIKNSAGNVIGISGIARDITERKKIEKDLLTKNAELSKLFFISSAMRGTLELDRLLRMILTAVTMGDGLGFNRAMLFLLDEERTILKGAMGVGPSSHEEAWRIWSTLSMEHKDLHSLIEDIDKSPLRKDSFMDRLCCGIELSLDSDTILARAVKEKKAFNVTDINMEPLSDPLLIQQLGTAAYAVVPLIAHDRVIGVLWVDNMFSRRPITEHDMEFLRGFTDQMASAVENARLFEHVAKAEQELENIFESISDLLYFTDRDFTVKKVNRAALEMLGKPQEEIIGKKSFDVFQGLFEQCKVRYQTEDTQTRKPFVEEIEDTQRGRTYLVSCSPILDNSKELIGTVHLVRDITEIKKLREKVSYAERMAALGEMAAKVAHEIRNPLLSIGGFARRLEKRLEGELKEYSKIIVDEVKSLEAILNDTLSFVKAGKLEIKIVEAGEIIVNVLNLLESAAHEKGNVLLKELQYPVTIFVDPNRFKEAVFNLVTNANEATANGVITVRAYKTVSFSEPDLLGHRAEENEAVIEVEDTGRGISEEDINRIFDPFFTTRPEGTGLGLSITKRIIEEHGGKIEIESIKDKGTKFKISLPFEEG
jgi:PAS domain S-box-containing protein